MATAAEVEADAMPFLRANVRRMLRVIDHRNLVVRSEPFGELIDANTGRAYDLKDPEIAYGLASAVKLAAAVASDT
ncbi:MAG: hypothetical protein IT562_10695 [Alphaproteobacteria bacterium]|nr:hypothetical protein [Alphaproteobacteria bacterium]